ncbi:apoptosis-stimulating of p53 protein 2 [Biomphalaria pfeifferi]|uniref:Apoptosis-stimulating of p53 protein 2 n=1 Tax=Biomphalaria pfeifferi TaxID=112525 RepID=A0AAD8B420_BIOPF|nr:apoptosis-stimulating of p53 protein 2 [Biomphalaria pfeifferi]
MYFAVVAKSGQEDASCVTEEKSGEDNAERKKTSIWVYTSENHGTSIEVPLTPETTVSDVLDCVRDPVRGEGYLVAVAGDTEYILQEGDNAFTFLYQIWNNSGSPLNFLLRYYSQHAEWPPPELEARRHQMRRPQKDQLPAHNKIPDKVVSMPFASTVTALPQFLQTTGPDTHTENLTGHLSEASTGDALLGTLSGSTQVLTYQLISLIDNADFTSSTYFTN